MNGQIVAPRQTVAIESYWPLFYGSLLKMMYRKSHTITSGLSYLSNVLWGTGFSEVRKACISTSSNPFALRASERLLVQLQGIE